MRGLFQVFQENLDKYVDPIESQQRATRESRFVFNSGRRRSV